MNDYEISQLRGSVAAAIRRETGVPVLAPLLTTKQEQRTRDMMFRIASEGFPSQSVVLCDAAWFVGYSAHLLPEADTPAWTKDLEGTATATVSGHLGTLELVEGDASGHLWYGLSHALSASAGVTLEATVKVASGEAMLSVHDGTSVFNLRLGTDTITLDNGTPSVVSRNLTAEHTLRLSTQNGYSEVYLDYALVALGSAAGSSTQQLVGFGTDPNDNTKVATIEVMDLRAADKKL